MEKERVVFLDWLRVIACFLVILTHCNEPFYFGGQGTYVASAQDAFWTSFFVSISRCCVPLFALASSYLLFPLRYDTKTFFKKRLVRVVVPLAIWLALYCIFSGAENIAGNFRKLLFNFPDPAGHLWFCYMLIGIYLLMPLLSPWAEKASKKEVQILLGLWLFTTLIPPLRELNIHVNGTWAIWGEGHWTEYGTFYYVSGFIGYLMLGLYFRKFVGELSWKKTLLIALPLFLGGFAIAAGWFYSFIPKDFPVDQPVSTAVHMEVMTRFCTISVAMMTIGAFLLIRKINCSGGFYKHIVLPVSKASYGMYLMHMFALVPLFNFWHSAIGTDGFWTTPAVVVLSAVCTYVLCALVSIPLQKIPKVGKYIIG